MKFCTVVVPNIQMCKLYFGKFYMIHAWYAFLIVSSSQNCVKNLLFVKNDEFWASYFFLLGFKWKRYIFFITKLFSVLKLLVINHLWKFPPYYIYSIWIFTKQLLILNKLLMSKFTTYEHLLWMHLSLCPCWHVCFLVFLDQHISYAVVFAWLFQISFLINM